nr:hypothetical protein [Opitutaceae bacterium]
MFPHSPRELRRFLTLCLGALTLILGAVDASATSDAPLDSAPVEIVPAGPSLPASAWRSGAVYARLGDTLLIVGGRQGDGWASDVLAIEPDASVRSIPVELPPKIEAVGVVHDRRLVLLGGRSSSSPSAAVHALALDNGALTTVAWPDLPLAGPVAGAAILQGRLYVLAGPSAAPADHTPLWSIDPARPGDGWRVEPALPSAPRARPLLAVQHGGLHVFGGESSADGAAAPSTAWAFLPRPREASVVQGWIRLPDAPRSFAVGTAWPAGQASILLHVETADGPRTLVYNAITEGWAELAAPALPTGSTAVAPPAARLALSPGSAAGEAPSLHTIAPSRYTRTLGLGDYLVILAYFAAMAGIGVYFGKKQDTPEEFTLGGRKVKWWAAG